MISYDTSRPGRWYTERLLIFVRVLSVYISSVITLKTLEQVL